MGQELPDLVSSKEILMTNAVLGLKFKPHPVSFIWEMQYQDELSDAEVDALRLSGLAPHRQQETLRKAFEDSVPLFAKKIANGFCFFTGKPNISSYGDKYTLTKSLGDAWALKGNNHITLDVVSSKVISVPIQKVSDKEYSDLNKALESEDAMVKACVQVMSVKPYVGDKLYAGPVRVELKFLSASIVSTKSRKELFKYPSGWLNSLADQ